MKEIYETVKEDADSYYFHQGALTKAYDYLGVQRIGKFDDKYVYSFRTFERNAIRVEIEGDFNGSDGIFMNRITGGGVWEAIYQSEIPLEGMRYKYRIVFDGETVCQSDPCARYFEWEKDGSSIIYSSEAFDWHDRKFVTELRSENQKCMNVCEPKPAECYPTCEKSIRSVAYLNYRELAEEISTYAKSNGYTHIKLAPFWLDGIFAPTSRHGTPEDFKKFIDTMHRVGIGIILELEACGEPENAEDRSLFLSSIYLWIKEFHIDGIEIGGVAPDFEFLKEFECFNGIIILKKRKSEKYS